MDSVDTRANLGLHSNDNPARKRTKTCKTFAQKVEDRNGVGCRSQDGDFEIRYSKFML